MTVKLNEYVRPYIKISDLYFYQCEADRCLTHWVKHLSVWRCQSAEATSVHVCVSMCMFSPTVIHNTGSLSGWIIATLWSQRCTALFLFHTLPVCVFFFACAYCDTLAARWWEFCLTWDANQKALGGVVLIAQKLFFSFKVCVCLCVRELVTWMCRFPEGFRIRMWNSRSAFRCWKPVGCCQSCWHTHASLQVFGWDYHN